MVEVDNRRWYDANCHCGRVRLRLHIAPLDDTGPNGPLKVINCNCSICSKNGYLNIYPDDPVKDIDWVSGKDDLKAYTFATKAVEHMFCPTCGSSIVLFVDASKLEENGRWEIGVNVSWAITFITGSPCMLSENGVVTSRCEWERLNVAIY